MNCIRIDKTSEGIFKQRINLVKSNTCKTTESLYDFISSEINNERNCQLIRTALQSLIKGKRKIDKVEMFYVRTFDIKNKEELSNYTFELIRFFYETKEFKKRAVVDRKDQSIRYYNDIFNKDFDYSANALTRKAIYEYYRLLINEMDDESFKKVLETNTKDYVISVLEDLSKKYNIKYTQDSPLFLTSIAAVNNVKKIRSVGMKQHLCATCELTGLDCLKRAECGERNIGEYTFIREGHQEWIENKENPGTMTCSKLLVYKCDKYMSMK